VTALAVTCLSPDLALPLTAPYRPTSATGERNRVYIGVLTSLTLSSSLLSLVSLLYRQNLQDQRLLYPSLGLFLTQPVRAVTPSAPYNHYNIIKTIKELEAYS
jgi:hypothetical protein